MLKVFRRMNPSLLAAILLLTAMVPAASPQATRVTQPASGPQVERVDPPNWWIGLPNPMLMITGEHLAGARVTTHTGGVRIVRTVEGREGRYLFVWAEIGTTARGT